MKKSSVALTVAALAVASVSFAAKQKSSDPTIMTVGPETVTLSEFDYLYKKNNEQQATATSLDDYIDMFVNYKLKVAAAKDAGLDTSANYLSDMAKYTRDLARPYMRDKAVDDSLVNAAYSHTLDMVNVDHILVPSTEKGRTRQQQRALADSIRQALLDGADFGELARRYSLDKASAAREGNMGYIVGGVWPYTFEDLAYNTPVGQLSPVTESAYGYHILFIRDRKPNPGSIKTRHILKMTGDMDEAGVARQRQSIDSILSVVRGGADFAEVARQTTDEPQGKSTGGDLPWFSTGQMVQEFNDAAFKLQPGQISDPVKTRFGWHIILCEGRRANLPLDSLREQIAGRIANDERSQLAVIRTIDKWKAAAGTSTSATALGQARKMIDEAGALTPDLVNSLSETSVEIASVGDDRILISDIAKMLRPDGSLKAADAKEIFSGALDAKINEVATNQFIASLPASRPEYRNLLNEYRDGMLLYEISNAEVWDRANADSLGLQRYFEARTNEYTWDRPHYKGFIIAAVTDSLAEQAIEYLNASSDINAAADTRGIRKRFGNEVKVERVLAGKGDNAVVDYLCFGGTRPQIKNRWKAYRAIGGKIIDAPEDARDVKGQVSLGYQQQLETEWLKRLHNRYKVKIDRKALRKAYGQ